MSLSSELKNQLKRSKRRAVAGAQRLVSQNTRPFDRLAALTPIASNHGQPKYLFSTHDLEMGPHIYASGAYDPDELSWALDYLGHPQRGGLVVDVGANVGTTTISLLTRYGAAAVEAFEPAPLNFKLLRCNLVLNDLDTRASVKRVAISDQDSDLRLELCDYNTGDHRIQAVDTRWEEMGESQRPTVKVEALRLDSALTAPASDVCLVWVDVQGHEAHVLAGASSLLGGKVPWVIEYWPYALTRAGGLDRLHGLIGEHFSAAVDVRGSMAADKPVVLASDEVARLSDQGVHWYTDLILLP
jgi:FkbM family methyltransferase